MRGDDRGNGMPRQVEANESVVAPTVCPFCQSTAVSTASKRVDVSTYWRCAKCNEVWNVGRQATQSGFRRRY